MNHRARYIIILVTIASVVAMAGGPKKYGKPLLLKEKTRISDILASPEKFDGHQVQIAGLVVDVCKRRGCWIKVAGEQKNESLLVKVEDGVIVFPQSAKGRTALVEGTVVVRKLTEEEMLENARHEAEEQGNKFDATAVKGPKTVVKIQGEGAIIK